MKVSRGKSRFPKTSLWPLAAVMLMREGGIGKASFVSDLVRLMTLLMLR
jgi:hypothetical protein